MIPCLLTGTNYTKRVNKKLHDNVSVFWQLKRQQTVACFHNYGFLKSITMWLQSPPPVKHSSPDFYSHRGTRRRNMYFILGFLHCYWLGKCMGCFVGCFRSTGTSWSWAIDDVSWGPRHEHRVPSCNGVRIWTIHLLCGSQSNPMYLSTPKRCIFLQIHGNWTPIYPFSSASWRLSRKLVRNTTGRSHR